MSPKAIAIIVGLILLIFIAGQPLGQMLVAIGGAIQTVGNSVETIGAKVHGG